MKKVTAENLKAGDILAKDIISGKGITVLKKGTVLTDKFIGNIKKITAESTGASDNYIFIEGTSGAESENDTENKEKWKKNCLYWKKVPARRKRKIYGRNKRNHKKRHN
jgi:hypothetical protein